MTAKLHGRVAKVPTAASQLTTGMAQGTQVLTAEGLLPVDYLAPGDRIITRDGMRILVDVTVQIVTGDVVRVCASSQGHARPQEDVILAVDQALMIRDWRAKALYGKAQAMVPVARMVDGEMIRREKVVGLRMYTLCFAAPQVIYAGELELGCNAVPVAA